MLKTLFIILSITLSVCNFAATAKSVKPNVSMIHLKAIKTAEKNGDELYLAVTAYPSDGQPTHYQIPKYPLHWPSAKLDSLKNIKIWQDKLKPGQAVTLIVSLLEQDSPPWNTDDLIGTVRIRMKNKDGQLETSWSMPNRVDAPVSVMTKKGRAEKFDLLGEGSNYQLYLHLEIPKT